MYGLRIDTQTDHWQYSNLGWPELKSRLARVEISAGPSWNLGWPELKSRLARVEISAGPSWNLGWPELKSRLAQVEISAGPRVEISAGPSWNLGWSELKSRLARVRISARHPMEVPPTEPATVKIWRWASANIMKEWLSECMYCKKKNKYTKRVA